MDAKVLNFKAYAHGAIIGFFDLLVAGLTISNCNGFQKEGDKFWFAWPSEKIQAKDGGEDKWRDLVSASEPVMRHLQGLVRPQLRALVVGNAGGAQSNPHRQQKPSVAGRRSGEFDDPAYRESRRAAQQDIGAPF